MVFHRSNVWLAVGALLGGLSVAFGAFGAHGLKSALESAVGSGLSAEEAARHLANWETAARYQMYHGLALLAVGFLSARRGGVALDLAGGAMTLGTLLFSGFLYAYVLLRQPWMVHIVPIGGALMILGWAALVVAVLRGDKSKPDA